MSHSIFITSPTALIAQPGRAVNTFPSGLVRVDQTYLGLTSQATAHRATLAIGNNMPDGDSSPCIDGLKIFPEVQEIRREDGFTEYLVSAYGRAKSTATTEPGIKNFSFFALSFTRKTATAKIVSHTIPDLSDLGFPNDAFDPIAGFRFTDTDEVFEADSIEKISTTAIASVWRFNFGTTTIDKHFLSPGINSRFEFAVPLPLTISQTNFGYWTEWVFAYG
jgi:hypothetical protein